MKYLYKAVAAVITNQTKNLFYLQQKDETYSIKEYRLMCTFFGGGVEKYETEKTAFKREIYEELDREAAGYVLKNSKRKFSQIIFPIFGQCKNKPVKIILFESLLSNKMLKKISKTKVMEGKRGVLVKKAKLQKIKFFDDLMGIFKKYLLESN